MGAGQEEASIEDAQGEDLQDASDLIDEALDEELAYQKNIETEAEEASVYQENIETGAEEATLYVRAAAKSGKWVLNRTGLVLCGCKWSRSERLAASWECVVLFGWK